MKYPLLKFLSLLLSTCTFSQPFVTKDVKAFGAKGDGKTNDQAAFERAADFFNKRGGNGKLIISKGTYIVGKQVISKGTNDRFGFQGEDVLHFSGIRNFAIQGVSGSRIRYEGGLKYGAFNPETGQPHPSSGYFVNRLFGASLGHCIFLDNAENVNVSSIELDGNNQRVILGGSYGDVGRQLPHYGIFIQNSKGITIDSVNLHHFALDGICVANKPTISRDKIRLLNSSFEYNARQGFSWIGGNDLYVKNCKFNHTGKAKFNSAPGAGVDIEAEYGPNRNAVFDNCEFVDNTGCAMVADSGDSGDCSFTNCTFWGVDNWSIWVNKPGFTFRGCRIYGSIVHGHDSPNEQEATKYINCHFEDKPYNGRPAFGAFLIEINNRKYLLFDNCTFIANTKKLCWIIEERAMPDEQKATIRNSRFIMNNKKFSRPDYTHKMDNIRIFSTTFSYPQITEDEFKKRYEWSGGSITGDGKNKNVFKK
jgi:hypothetical protein